MRIALLADTHLPRFGRALPRALVEGLREHGVELILHAGDWTAPFAVDLLAGIAPVEGVAGNNDPTELVERFGQRRVVGVGGARLGLTHGHLGVGRTTPERALAAFADTEGLVAVCFGHSHIPVVERLPDGRWLLNPGSPTDRRRQPRFTWLFLEVEHGRLLEPRLVAYDQRTP